MRNSYLVCYDICDDKRLRQVFKICRNHGNHLQYSIFECDLNETERIDLEQQLAAVIHHTEDQVLFVCLGPGEGRGTRDITALGIPSPALTTAAMLYEVSLPACSEHCAGRRRRIAIIRYIIN